MRCHLPLTGTTVAIGQLQELENRRLKMHEVKAPRLCKDTTNPLTRLTQRHWLADLTFQEGTR
jgi:hypothetical protein